MTNVRLRQRVLMSLGALLCVAALDTCRGVSTACAMSIGCVVLEPPCPGDSVAVSVSGGQDFGWSPGCYMAWVEVLDSAGATVWRLIDRHNRLQPTIRYGHPPTGTVETALATLLVPGAMYRVTVRRSVPDSLPLVLYGGGTTTFAAAGLVP